MPWCAFSLLIIKKRLNLGNVGSCASLMAYEIMEGRGDSSPWCCRLAALVVRRSSLRLAPPSTSPLPPSSCFLHSEGNETTLASEGLGFLQLVERMLSGLKTHSIMLNGVVRKGEWLVPPSALDLLMNTTFPAPFTHVKAIERFEVVYPNLKELALAGSPGTKTTKQALQQLLPYTIKAMQESVCKGECPSLHQPVLYALSPADTPQPINMGQGQPNSFRQCCMPFRLLTPISQ